MDQIGSLFDDLQRLRISPGTDAPRTRRLLKSRRLKKAKKVGEEGVEVALEAVRGDRRKTVEESVDLLYNLVVLWEDMGIEPAEIWTEMARRRLALGVSEKLPKKPGPARKKAAGRKARPSATKPAGER